MINDIQTEIDEVAQLVHTVPDKLDSPLKDVVSSQIASLSPNFLAWFVLSSGVNADKSDDMRSKRIYLAAALETLYLALNIHKYLLHDDSERLSTPQRETYVGSIILAGDYCFSRSAEFAAQTSNPVVVSIFSEALMEVSEGHLRQWQEKHQEEYNAVEALLVAGTDAATELCDLSKQHKLNIRQLSKQMAAEISSSSMQVEDGANNIGTTGINLTNVKQSIDNLPSVQQERWELLFQNFAIKNL